MPIVEVEFVLGPNESLHKEMITELADEFGAIFKSPQGGTWVKVHGLPAEHYAENGGMQEDVYPVFVSILKSKRPLMDEMQIEVEKITSVVAQICGRSSENIHVIYQPEGRGRIAFGGKIVS